VTCGQGGNLHPVLRFAVGSLTGRASENFIALRAPYFGLSPEVDLGAHAFCYIR